MFTGKIVDTIVRAADVFGGCVGREMQGFPPNVRMDLALAFERALDQTATALRTKTADVAIARIKPKVRTWLGV